MIWTNRLMGGRGQVKYFWLPIGIAGWTILQSLVHVWWILYGREMIACEIKVKRKLEFYLYLTYFYSNECDNYALNEYASISFNSTDTETSDMLRSLGLSVCLYKPDGTMTDSLMNIYLAFDAIWIVTAVSLLIGVIMRLKQCSALIFYSPWILLAAFTCLMDLFSSLYFGLQIDKAEIVQSPFPWKLENHVVMAIISGRLGLIWIVNLANILYICWFTRVSHRQRYSDENKKSSISPRLKMRRQDTENRIKSWQLFYGAIEEDLDYATTFKDLEEYNSNRRNTVGSIPEHELCSTFKSSSSGNETTVEACATMTEGNLSGHPGNKKKVQITELVSHLPWSYIDNANKNANKKLFTMQGQKQIKGESKLKKKDCDNDTDGHIDEEENNINRCRRVVVVGATENV